MKSDETISGNGGDTEELHHDRLMALLHDLVRNHGGRRGAARVLGVDRRTVAACMDGKEMAWRIREALERALQEGVGSAAERERRRNEDLERRVEQLEGWKEALMEETGNSLEADAGDVETLREEYTRKFGQVERRLGQLEIDQGVHSDVEDSDETTKPTAGVLEPRRFPEVVTKDPAPDDKEIYGAAWPLIDEWRELWKGHSNQGRSLSWLATEERIRELEVAMLEDHGLTLPPETEPLRGLDRSSQLNWRRETLREVRMTRARQEFLWSLLRVLTLGLWRK